MSGGSMNHLYYQLDGYGSISDEQMQSALLDEIGELNHELKGGWCWWKKTQKEPDRAKVLEEFVDVVHFVLMWTLRKDALEAGRGVMTNFTIGFENGRADGYETVDYLASLLDDELPRLKGLMTKCLAKSLGFEWAEVYEAYKAKNAVNRQRIQDNY